MPCMSIPSAPRARAHHFAHNENTINCSTGAANVASKLELILHPPREQFKADQPVTP